MTETVTNLRNAVVKAVVSAREMEEKAVFMLAAVESKIENILPAPYYGSRKFYRMVGRKY